MQVTFWWRRECKKYIDINTETNLRYRYGRILNDRKFMHKHIRSRWKQLSLIDHLLRIKWKIDRFKLNCMYREYKLWIIAILLLLCWTKCDSLYVPSRCYAIKCKCSRQLNKFQRNYRDWNVLLLVFCFAHMYIFFTFLSKGITIKLAAIF